MPGATIMKWKDETVFGAKTSTSCPHRGNSYRVSCMDKAMRTVVVDPVAVMAALLLLLRYPRDSAPGLRHPPWSAPEVAPWGGLALLLSLGGGATPLKVLGVELGFRCSMF